jgi:ribonuclease P protein component
VGVKVSPKATQRNLLKRRLREIWRVMSIPSDVAVTLYTTKTTLGLSFAELKRVVAQLTHQLTKE